MSELVPCNWNHPVFMQCTSALSTPALRLDPTIRSLVTMPMIRRISYRTSLLASMFAVSEVTLSGASALAAEGRPLVIAHRGASHDAPENTLAAFNLAWQQGADGCEGDFRLSADGKIVCIHDADTQRTGGRKLSVAGSRLADLRTLDVGSWKSPEYSGERIPTLAEVLQTVPAGKLFYIEIKCGPEIISPLANLLRQQRWVAFNQLRIISFNTEVIAAAKRVLPNIKAFWLTNYDKEHAGEQNTSDGSRAARAVYSPNLQTILETLSRTGADGLGSQANLDVVNQQFAHTLREAGFELHTWTVDDPRTAQALTRAGSISITTNRPKMILALWPRHIASRNTAPLQRPIGILRECQFGDPTAILFHRHGNHARPFRWHRLRPWRQCRAIRWW
ncbi:MAG: glycerophosphodiester phosphodiesterase [Pirellulales bacterium]|nr:glycerophosphodiester phosphodiesterase [Pirellulales bacterium]